MSVEYIRAEVTGALVRACAGEVQQSMGLGHRLAKVGALRGEAGPFREGRTK